MATCFLFRHQHAGIITSHVFAKQPTAAQLAPMIAEAERLHGNRPGKDGKPPWHSVVEVELVTDAVPSFPDRENSGAKDNIASPPRVTVSGAGTVSPAAK
jgi:hypothetical protein